MNNKALKEYFELEPEDSHFVTIVADLTHKCNMKCSNCYIPNRTIPDMDKEKLFNFLRRLNKRTEIRLVGAEPTLRDDLPEIIKKVRLFGHRPIVLTNGLKLSDKKYVEKLLDSGLKSIYLSMNGGIDDNVYLKMDGLRCSKMKELAFKNLSDKKVVIGLGCILQKGMNEHVPLQLINLIKKYKPAFATLRFRNVGQIGRFSQKSTDSYSFSELISIVSKALKIEDDFVINNKFIGEHDCKTIFCKLPENYIQGTKLLISFTNWNELERDPSDFGKKELRRGRITQNFKVAPFFEHLLLNEGNY